MFSNKTGLVFILFPNCFEFSAVLFMPSVTWAYFYVGTACKLYMKVSGGRTAATHAYALVLAIDGIQ